MKTTRHTAQKIIKACLCAIAILLIWSSICSAQAPEITATLSLDRNQATVGDIITATLEIKGPPALSVNVPEPSSFLGDLELRNAKKPLSQEKEGKKSIIYQFEITPFTTGKKEIGPIKIRYSLKGTAPAPEEESSPSVDTNKVTLDVTSVLPKEAKNLDIKDIKPPIEVKYPLSYYIIGALSILAAALVIYLLVRYLRNRMRKKGEEGPAVPKTPEEVAREKLRNLRESALLEQGRVKEYYTVLTDVLREYLVQRHSINARDMTTTELYRVLRDSTLLAPLSGEIKSLMTQGDMVKFARAVPLEARIEEDYRETERLFQALIPQDIKQEGEEPSESGDRKNRS